MKPYKIISTTLAPSINKGFLSRHELFMDGFVLQFTRTSLSNHLTCQCRIQSKVQTITWIPFIYMGFFITIIFFPYKFLNLYLLTSRAHFSLAKSFLSYQSETMFNYFFHIKKVNQSFYSKNRPKKPLILSGIGFFFLNRVFPPKIKD